MKKPNILLHLILLTVVSLAGAVLTNAVRSTGAIPWVKDWEAAKAAKAEEIVQKATEEGFILVEDIKEVRKIVESGEYVVLDARSTEKYDEGHIPGALSLPNDEKDEKIAEVDAFLSFEKKTLVYCTSVECDASHLLATYLQELGFTNLYLFPGGFMEWEEKQQPIEKN